MSAALLLYLHVLGAVVIGGGLLGVFVSDLRARRAPGLTELAEASGAMAVFYDLLVVPGALLLAASGGWLVYSRYGGWAFLEVPWLAGMVLLFLFEFVEGNTVTRAAFLRLRRLSKESLKAGRVSDALRRERARRLPSFTHFLDLPVLCVIIALGVLKPSDWLTALAGMALAMIMATLLTLALMRPQREPWASLTAAAKSGTDLRSLDRPSGID